MAEVNIKKIDAFFEAAGKNPVVATAETSKGESFLVLTALSDVSERGAESKEDDAKETLPPRAPQEDTAEVSSSEEEDEDEVLTTSDSDQENTENESFTLRLRLKNHPFYKSEYIHLSDRCIADIKNFMVTVGMGALGWIMGWTIGLSTGAASMHRC